MSMADTLTRYFIDNPDSYGYGFDGFDAEEAAKIIHSLEARLRKQANVISCESKRVAELEASPWISVEDRLPEESGRYLVKRKERDEFERDFVCPYRVVGFYGHKDDPNQMWLDGGNITHWMPIPEIPA